MKIKILLVLVLLLFYTEPIEATSGRIGAKKISYCSGQAYGRHGDDEHWHMAEKKGDYWYAVGEDLGYTHPCPATPAPAPQAEAATQPESKPHTNAVVKPAPAPTQSSKPEQASTSVNKPAQVVQGNAAPKGESQKQKQDRIEKEKLEKERLEKTEKEKAQKLAAEKEAAEKLELLESDTTIYSIALSDYILSPNSVSFYDSLDKDLDISLASKDTSYSITNDIQSKPFTVEEINVAVTSKNKKNTKDYKYKVARLGTQEDLNSQNIVLSWGDQTYDYVDGHFSVPYKEMKKLNTVKPGLSINNINVKDVSLEDLKTNQSISFIIGDKEYTLSINPIKDNEGFIGLGIVSVSFLLIGSGIHISKKRKIKS